MNICTCLCVNSLSRIQFKLSLNPQIHLRVQADVFIKNQYKIIMQVVKCFITQYAHDCDNFTFRCIQTQGEHFSGCTESDSTRLLKRVKSPADLFNTITMLIQLNKSPGDRSLFDFSKDLFGFNHTVTSPLAPKLMSVKGANSLLTFRPFTKMIFFYLNF